MGADKNGVGCHNLTEEEIVQQIEGYNEEVGKDCDNEADNYNIQKSILSRMLEMLMNLLTILKMMKIFKTTI